jgi:hypothetical protein
MIFLTVNKKGRDLWCSVGHLKAFSHNELPHRFESDEIRQHLSEENYQYVITP